MKNSVYRFFLLAATAAAFGEIELQLPGGGAVGAGATPQPAKSTAPEADDFGMLELANGDRLKVAIERLDPATGLLTVRHPLMRGPVNIEAAAVLRYAAEPLRYETTDLPGFLMYLQDGDRIRGLDITLDAERVRFNSMYGGEISLPRTSLLRLSPSGSRSLYDGPTFGEEWIVGGVRMYLETAGLPLGQDEVVGRIIPGLGRKLRIDFKISGSYFIQGMSVNFFAQRPGVPPSQNNSGYQLRLSTSERLVLRRFLPGQGAQDVGSANSPLQGAGGRLLQSGIRITILGDLDEQRFQILSDGRLIADFKDNFKFLNAGNAISFSSQSYAVISDLTVSRWDGGLATPSDLPANDKDDVLRLKSGDTVSGELISLRRDQATLRTTMGELNIPIAQIESLTFRRNEMSPEDASTGDLIRLQLLDDSRLRVSVKKIEDGVIWADHARAGSLRIPVKAVGGLVWRAPSDSRDAPSPPREQQQIPPKIQPLDRVKPDQGARAVADDRTTT